MPSDGVAGTEIDPAWWESALEADDPIEAEWRPPEVTSRRLAILAEEAPKASAQRDLLVALARVSSAMLNPESWDEPFKPMWEWDGQRSALPTDLAEPEFQLLAKALPSITHPLLRARVADALWCFYDRSNLDWLGIALDGYLAVPLEHDAWIHRGQDAWRRAIEIVRRRGAAEEERLGTITEALTSRILDGTTSDGFMIVDLSDMVRTAGPVAPETGVQLAAHFAGLAAEAAENGNLRMSRHLERKAQTWFRSTEDSAAVNASAERVARLYLREADERMTGGGDGAAMAAGLFLEKAIGTLRTLPRRYRTEHGLDDTLADLRHRLADNREETLESMHRIQTEPIDLTDAIADTRRRLSGHTRFEALVRLAASWPLADPARERAQAEELAMGSIRHLFSGATYAADGRKVATTEGGATENKAAIWADMVRGAGMKRGLATTAFIVPGLAVITFEHRYDLPFLRRLCMDSPWVPTGHVDLWARGLGHGLSGDFPSAVSVLVPQIEQALRQVLKGLGAYTLAVDDTTGVETEKGLPALLSMPETVEAIGADLQYELTTLLIEQAGDNLRHDTAHGLLHDGQAWSHGAVYAWWLCLRLMIVPLWNMINDSPVASGTDPGAGDSSEVNPDTCPYGPDQ